jgi:hypothetical protein
LSSVHWSRAVLFTVHSLRPALLDSASPSETEAHWKFVFSADPNVDQSAAGAVASSCTSATLFTVFPLLSVSSFIKLTHPHTVATDGFDTLTFLFAAKRV